MTTAANAENVRSPDWYIWPDKKKLTHNWAGTAQISANAAPKILDDKENSVEMPDGFDLSQMNVAAEKASALMKTLGHKGRLMVLCQLANGEKSVGELSDLLGMPQSPLSQHLSRMRKEGLVKTRREAQTIFYSLKADEAGKIIECLYSLYCANDD